jgi:hypothetical protein
MKSACMGSVSEVRIPSSLTVSPSCGCHPHIALCYGSYTFGSLVSNPDCVQVARQSTKYKHQSRRASASWPLGPLGLTNAQNGFEHHPHWLAPILGSGSSVSTELPRAKALSKIYIDSVHWPPPNS